MTQKNSSGPFHREPGLFGVNCCFCTAGINEGYPISENGKLVVLTSGRPAFQQYAEHAEGSDTPPLSHARKALSTGHKATISTEAKKITQPSGAATPEKADTRRRAYIHFLRLFFRWQFRWQHKAALWSREGMPLFRRVSRCVRSFSESRVCTRFHP